MDLVEVELEKRSVDRRKFQVNLFGDDVVLNLERSKDFLPETLLVHFLDVDENGEEVVTDWSHRVSEEFELILILHRFHCLCAIFSLKPLFLVFKFSICIMIFSHETHVYCLSDCLCRRTIPVCFLYLAYVIMIGCKFLK